MDKVSIIMPAYNCRRFIDKSIESVLAQTYPEWELLVVDDCSTDETRAIINQMAAADERIRCISLEENSGASVARNKAIEQAQGRYIAFLDSDDIWCPEKLEKQIGFMQRNGYRFSCTSYRWIDEAGNPLKCIKKPFKKAGYSLCLYYGNSLGNSTVIYDAQALGKHYAPAIDKRNDFALWLEILRSDKENKVYAYGLQEILSNYRHRSHSLSSNKAGLIKYHWQLYREIEKLNFFRSAFALGTLIVRKIYKRIF